MYPEHDCGYPCRWLSPMRGVRFVDETGERRNQRVQTVLQGVSSIEPAIKQTVRYQDCQGRDCSSDQDNVRDRSQVGQGICIWVGASLAYPFSALSNASAEIAALSACPTTTLSGRNLLHLSRLSRLHRHPRQTLGQFIPLAVLSHSQLYFKLRLIRSVSLIQRKPSLLHMAMADSATQRMVPGTEP